MRSNEPSMLPVAVASESRTGMLSMTAGNSLMATLAASVEGDGAARAMHCQRLFAAMFESNPMAIMITDRRNRIVAVNPGFSRLTGYSETEAIGQMPSLLKSGRHDAAFYQAMWGALRETGEWIGEIWDRRKDGSFYPKWAHIRAVHPHGADNEPDGYVASFTDLSAHKEAEERIHTLAYHDVLTGLPNRLLLHDRLEHALAKAQRRSQAVAVLYLDLDNFKNINDSLGHAVGDQLLIEVANRLRASVRDMDTVARLGGDEFVVLLENLEDTAAAASVAAKVHAGLARPIQVGSQSLHADASIGIALYPADGDNAASLLQNADTAMYQAKARGRGNHQYYAAFMNAQAREQLALETTLYEALENDEFQLHYQPIIDLDSGAMTGVEALIRWQAPGRGLIAPDTFIRIAEETGAIVPIGDWVIRQACHDLAAWAARGLEPPQMSINISPRQLRQPGLAARIRSILRETGIAPHLLELEVTESALMERPDIAAEILRELKAMGLSIAIDDFGVGYSSLGYLKTFPIDKLKIDRSFVSDLLDDDNDREITLALISLSHNLGLRVTAEGVELQAQLEFLREHGCDQVQGYLFSRPLPSSAFQSFLVSRARFLCTDLAKCLLAA